VSVLGLVGGAPAQGWGGGDRASPIHRAFFRIVDVTVLVLVGGAPGGETSRVADSSVLFFAIKR
jgi:hypothetical protein